MTPPREWWTGQGPGSHFVLTAHVIGRHTGGSSQNRHAAEWENGSRLDLAAALLDLGHRLLELRVLLPGCKDAEGFRQVGTGYPEEEAPTHAGFIDRGGSVASAGVAVGRAFPILSTGAHRSTGPPVMPLVPRLPSAPR